MKTGTLYMVSTPIGNLEDITARALNVLRMADLIACEDTRKSRVLLKRWDISTRLMSLHRFSESRKIQTILQRLERGENVALITDAGTPAISDPGSRVVRAALEAGFTVTAIPGPSAITAALSISGMDASSFVFLGFVPRKERERRAFFESLLKERRTSVFLETPKRIQATLELASETLGRRQMVLLRELTKLHEEILSGTAADILTALEAKDAIRGEIVVVVEGAAEAGPQFNLEEAVKTLMQEGWSGKRLADEAHKRFGFKKGEAYQKFLEMQLIKDPAK